MSIIKLERHEISNALPLFSDIPLGWDVMLDAAKDFGFFAADDRNRPNVALAFIGGCIIYAGDAGHPNARDLVEAMKVQPVVLPYPEDWARLVKEVFEDQAKVEQRFFFPFSSIDDSVLDGIELNPPHDFELRRIDSEIASRLEAEMGEVAQIHHYFNLDDFVNRGGGFCILKGSELCSIAIAFMRGDNAIQIQIITKENYRRQGLATLAGTALLKQCRRNGIRADWDASNASSKALALKIGYTDCIPYTAISVFPD